VAGPSATGTTTAGGTDASSASTGSSAAATTGATSGGGTATITHWQHQSDAREALVKGFITKFQDQTGNTVDFQSIPYDSYFQKLGTALEAGSGPCDFQMPANIVGEFVKRGQIATVPDDVMSTADIETAFTPASINLLKVDGKYYGLPTDVQTMLLFYNDDLFKAAGLDPTKDFTSWDELRAAATALTKRNGDTLVQAGMDISSSPYQWYYSAPTLAFPDGLVNDETGLVNYADAAGYDVWQKLTDLVKVDKVDSPEFLANQSKFGLGKAGMVLREYTFSGVYKLTAPDVHFSVHIAPPVADKQYGKVGSTSWSYVVNKSCADQAAAWSWVTYLTSEESERTWIAGGGELPARTSLLGDAELKKDPAVAVGFESLSDAVPYDSKGWDDVFAIQQEIWDEIAVGGEDVKTAVDKGAAAENALYKKKGLV
jgi:multiple sugar transport system substrate-binding protein